MTPWRFRIVGVADCGQPMEMLLADLTAVEQEQAHTLPTERRRRHFALGRSAAHAATRRVLGGRTPPPGVEVIVGSHGEPVVYVDGAAHAVAVSLSHSGNMAVACAWPTTPVDSYSVGIDLERRRPTDIAESDYAFSAQERALLSRAPEGPRLAGLAAWTIKEAAFKALRARPSTDPVSIEIRALNLARGQVRLRLRRNFLAPLDLRPQAWVGAISGIDGPYILSIAVIAARDVRVRKVKQRLLASVTLA